jgi:hypothetical protein
MDLKELYTLESHEEGAEIQIKSPIDNELTDFFITVKGIDSKSYRNAIRKYHRSILDDKEGGEIDLLVAITMDWKGLMDNGKEVKFSAEKAKELYTNAPSVASQIDQFVANRRNFTTG